MTTAREKHMEPGKLEYGREPNRGAVFRRLIKPAIYLIGVTILAAALYLACNWYIAHRCFTHRFSPKTIVYTEATLSAGEASTYADLGRVPEAAHRFVRRTDRWWEWYSQRIDTTGDPDGVALDGLLYVHRIVGSGGEERLVVVGLDAKKPSSADFDPEAMTTRLSFRCFLIREEGLFGRPVLESVSTVGQGGNMLGSDSDTAFSPGNLTIYGGEPDLDHPDQFTIEWRFNDYHGTAVGRVGYGPPEFGNSFLTVDIEGLP